MYAIYRHEYDHKNKHRCRNKIKAVKERTHRILYWFGVTLHPVPQHKYIFPFKNNLYNYTLDFKAKRYTLQNHNPLGSDT